MGAVDALGQHKVAYGAALPSGVAAEACAPSTLVV